MILCALVCGIQAAVGIAGAGCSTSRSDTAGRKVPALVSVPDSVGSGLCVVTSVS